jgi:polyhydroxyalkanoate synthesis regulator phasin
MTVKIKRPIKKSLEDNDEPLPWGLTDGEVTKSFDQAKADFSDLWAQAWDYKRNDGDKALTLTKQCWNAIEEMFRSVVYMAHGDMCATHKRITTLEQRIAELEKGAEYRGIWSPGSSYIKGNSVTFQGGIWICKEDTDSRPGTDSTWQLAVKRGSRPYPPKPAKLEVVQ